MITGSVQKVLMSFSYKVYLNNSPVLFKHSFYKLAIFTVNKSKNVRFPSNKYTFHALNTPERFHIGTFLPFFQGYK